MAKLTVKDRMARSIALRKGEVVMRGDFEQMGSASQISRALKGLVLAGKIVRLGYGVYAKARPSILSGKPVPRVTLEELTQETLEKLGVVPRLGRAQAAYVAGVTTQIPVHTTFNTGQRRISRKITRGISTVRFQNEYRCEREKLKLKLASMEFKRPSKTAEQICRCIEEIPAGEPFTSGEFIGLGTRAAVDQTLSRLTKIEAIMRVARGIYCRPVDGRFGRYGSSEKKVVDLIAKGETLQVHGARAANIMGLSTQVPMSSIYLTSGRSRTLLIRNKTVEFRHASSRKLLLAGRPAGIALTAMWYLGKAEVTPRLVGKIRRKLGAEEFEALKSVINDMPAWMRAAMLVDEQIHKNEQRRKLRESGLGSGSTVAPIPPTSLSPLVYIGGLAALNLPSPTGTGDWHLEETFFSQNPPASRSFLFGVGCETDTTSFFEEEGICDDFYDCTEILDKLCIPHEGAVAYAATHARAVADLILGAVLRGESPDYVVLDDWMPGTWDKEKVIFLLDEAGAHLTKEQQELLWALELKNQFSHGYGG